MPPDISKFYFLFYFRNGISWGHGPLTLKNKKDLEAMQVEIFLDSQFLFH